MCVPQTIATTILGRWPFSHDACQAQGYFVITLACASFQILTLTALNRFYRIVRTTHYRSTFTKNKTIIMIALCSGLACFEPIPYLLSGKRYVFHPGKVFCVQAKDISFPNFIIFLFLCVPAFTLSICYLLIFKKLRSHQQMVQNNLHSSTLSGRITHRDIKVTKILFITVIGFLTCWTPLAVIDFVDTFRGEVSFPRQVYFIRRNYSQGNKSHQNSIYHGNCFLDLLDTACCHRFCGHFPRGTLLPKANVLYVFHSGKLVRSHKPFHLRIATKELQRRV